jgi:hypothetical protein
VSWRRSFGSWPSNKERTQNAERHLEPRTAPRTSNPEQHGVTVQATLTLSNAERRDDERWIKVVLRDAPANRIDGRAPRGNRALASITFVDARVPGDIMYGSLDAARLIVRAARLERMPPEIQERLAIRLLGRAIAHEIGHYLLASQDHSPRGLMRDSFGPRELLADRHDRLTLLPDEVSALSLAR